MNIVVQTQRAQMAMSRFEDNVNRFKAAARVGNRPQCEALRLEAWQCLDEYFNAMQALVAGQ